MNQRERFIPLQLSWSTCRLGRRSLIATRAKCATDGSNSVQSSIEDCATVFNDRRHDSRINLESDAKRRLVQVACRLHAGLSLEWSELKDSHFNRFHTLFHVHRYVHYSFTGSSTKSRLIQARNTVYKCSGTFVPK